MLEGEGFRLRRASAEDVDFMADLAVHDAVEPFMAAVSPRGREELLEEVLRSDEEPQLHGRFVLEVEGDHGCCRSCVSNHQILQTRLDRFTHCRRLSRANGRRNLGRLVTRAPRVHPGS